MSEYLLIYNDDKIIYAGLKQDIKEIEIHSSYEIETFNSAVAFSRKMKEITKNNSKDMNEYIALYDIAIALRKISYKLNNNHFHTLIFEKEEIENFSNSLEKVSQEILNILDAFCLLDEILGEEEE